MLKWILNKDLKFQIVLVLFLALSVPTAVLIWNILVPARMSDAVRIMQEDKSRNLLNYIDETIDKTKIINIKNESSNEKAVAAFLEPLSKIARDTRIGIYYSEDNKIYTYGKLLDKRGNKKAEEINYTYIDNNIESSLKNVQETKSDKSEYISYNEREIQRYFHPLTVDNKVIAVTWSDTVMPPELKTTRNIFISLILIVPLGLLISVLLLIAIIKNLNNNIKKIKHALETMSTDLSYRIEHMGGDIGSVADSINTMAEELEKKEKLEEQLARTEKLASLGQMISGVAHEIRNPLGIIRGTVQLMERDFKNDTRLTEYIKIVKEQSDRESKVIQELLDYARPSKQMLIEMNINMLIKSVLSFTNKYIQDKHVKIINELEEKISLVNIDCDKIKQVFVNIIINACEAMENGGTLKISTKEKDGFIITSFEDNGTGMDDEQIKNIFNPYYTTKASGTGLGLSISNGIIQLHGGFIEVISKKGEGSKFIIKIPIYKREGENNG